MGWSRCRGRLFLVFFMKDVYTKDDVTKFKELVEAGCYEFAFIWFVIQ